MDDRAGMNITHYPASSVRKKYAGQRGVRAASDRELPYLFRE